MCDFLITNWAAILDTAAKVVGIFAGIGLWVAYRKYKHSVKIAKQNERRAAVELAARECANYGSVLMMRLATLRKEIDAAGCEYLKHCKLIKEGQQLKLDTAAVTEEDRQKLKQHEIEIACVLNSLEGFAIPFASDVADNRIGFLECGRSFVSVFEESFALYAVANLQHYYKASQTLYWRWKGQIEQEELERKHAQVGKEFLVLTEKVVRGERNTALRSVVASLLRKGLEKLEQRS